MTNFVPALESVYGFRVRLRDHYEREPKSKMPTVSAPFIFAYHNVYTPKAPIGPEGLPEISRVAKAPGFAQHRAKPRQGRQKW
jgi:hypothetical protein